MKITPALLSVNFSEGRAFSPVDTIVIHVTEGSAASVRQWFRDPAANVSSHYLVTKVGTVEQFVREDDTAWTQGRVDRPTAAVVLERPLVNPNAYCIGIEHEGDGKHELTDEQRAASVELILDICTRRHIPIDRHHIIGHHEIFFPKACPGAISVDRIVADVKTRASTVRPPAPRVVWSHFFNDWLIVTRVESDTAWWFVRLGSLRAVTLAEVPLSSMPTP